MKLNKKSNYLKIRRLLFIQFLLQNYFSDHPYRENIGKYPPYRGHTYTFVFAEKDANF